jgi:hypothetical protein
VNTVRLAASAAEFSASAAGAAVNSVTVSGNAAESSENAVRAVCPLLHRVPRHILVLQVLL